MEPFSGYTVSFTLDKKNWHRKEDCVTALQKEFPGAKILSAIKDSPNGWTAEVVESPRTEEPRVKFARIATVGQIISRLLQH